MVYVLDSDGPAFPPVAEAEPEGLLAVGGALSVPWLVAAYGSGIFPWYADGQPILWWAPDPRAILPPEHLRVTKSLDRVIRNGGLEVRWDTAFDRVIRLCADVPRADQDGTWITQDMVDAYIDLHRAGFAHSVEVYDGASLAGGLYGVSLGRAFFGESMFSLKSNASKVALVALVRCLEAEGFELIDCQMPTPHLETLGAIEIPRASYMTRLAASLERETHRGSWTHWGCQPRQNGTTLA